MRRKRGPILSDDDVNRIRRDGISTHRESRKKKMGKAVLKRIQEASILYPGFYSVTHAQHMAMLRAEAKLIQDMRDKRKAERNRIRPPRDKDRQWA